MILRYCDACGQQIEVSHSDKRLVGEIKKRHEGRVTTVCVEVHAAVNGTWNGGDVCRDCVIDAVLSQDTRPRMAESA